jgi:hypothetical protein
MRRSVSSAVAALVLVTVLGAGTTVAAPPAPPQITGASADWSMEAEDGVATPICHLRAHATVDPAFTRGAPVFWRAYMHVAWVGPGGEAIAWRILDTGRLARAETALDTIAVGFNTEGQGYYIVDGIRFELATRGGRILGSLEISTADTCL